MAILQGAEQLIPVSGSQLQIGDIVFGDSLTDLQRSTIGRRTFGYSTGYRGLYIGDNDTPYGNTVSLWFNVDLSANTNGSFSGDGSEYFYRNNAIFGTPNSANTGYHYYFQLRDGEIVLTHPTANVIRLPTSDGSDNRTLSITAGGAVANSRGAYMTMNGNEAAGLGSVAIHSGNASAGVGINIMVNSSNGELNLGTNATNRLGITSGGEVYFTNGVLRLNTTNGSDNGEMKIVASGANNATRSGAIQLYGNNHGASAIRGAVEIYASTAVSGAYVKVAGPSTGSFQVEGLDGLRFTNSTFTIRSNTADASDNAILLLTAAGAFGDGRGGGIALYGEQAAGNPGEVRITSVGTGPIVLRTGAAERLTITAAESNANPLVTIQHTNGNVSLQLGTGSTSALTANQYSGALRFNGAAVAWGDLAYYPNGGTEGHIRFSRNGSSISSTPSGRFGIGSIFIKDSPGIIFDATSAGRILCNTSDGADTSSVWMTGGGGFDFFGGTRGAGFIAIGNDAGGDGGTAYMGSGNSASATLTFRLCNTSGSYYFYVGSAVSWTIPYAGHFIPGNHNSYDVGSSGSYVRNIYSVEYLGQRSNLNRGNATGQAASGYHCQVDGTTYSYFRLTDQDIDSEIWCNRHINITNNQGGGGATYINGDNDTGLYINAYSFRPLLRFSSGGTLVGQVFSDVGGFATGSSNSLAIRGGNSSNGVHLAVGATSWSTHSDSRLKTDVDFLFEDTVTALQKVNALRPVTFKFLTDEVDTPKRLGFIAQEVKASIPEVIDGSDETIYSMRTTDLIPFLVGAIQQLKADNDALKARIEALES